MRLDFATTLDWYTTHYLFQIGRNVLPELRLWEDTEKMIVKLHGRTHGKDRLDVEIQQQDLFVTPTPTMLCSATFATLVVDWSPNVGKKVSASSTRG